jgi:hypothetical protein
MNRLEAMADPAGLKAGLLLTPENILMHLINIYLED